MLSEVAAWSRLYVCVLVGQGFGNAIEKESMNIFKVIEVMGCGDR